MQPNDELTRADEEIIEERQKWLQKLHVLNLKPVEAEMIAGLVNSEYWPVLYKVLEGIQELERNSAFDAPEALEYKNYLDAYAISKAVDRIADTLEGLANGYREFVQTVKDIREGA